MPSNDPHPEALNKRAILITAGPTHEPIDEVRYLANRSSGRLGIELAKDAAKRGHPVTLLLGPGPDKPHDTGIRTHRFQTSADLRTLLGTHFRECDALIMAAAVADYRPVVQTDAPHPLKMPRTSEGLTLHLEPVPDLVAECAMNRSAEQIIVAFALEPADRLESSGRDKLVRKGVDAVVANALSTMDSPTIDTAWFFTPDGELALDPSLDKADFARWLVPAIESRLESGRWTCLGEPPVSL